MYLKENTQTQSKKNWLIWLLWYENLILFFIFKSFSLNYNFIKPQKTVIFNIKINWKKQKKQEQRQVNTVKNNKKCLATKHKMQREIKKFFTIKICLVHKSVFFETDLITHFLMWVYNSNHNEEKNISWRGTICIRILILENMSF